VHKGFAIADGKHLPDAEWKSTVPSADVNQEE